jgi:hypothetical protein
MTFVSIVFALGCLVALPQVVGIWTHRTATYDEPAAWWPYSDAAWRGWVRGLPVTVIGASLMAAAGVVGGFTGVIDSEAPLTDTASGAVVFVLGLAAFLLIVLGMCALYVNAPKWIVPRHLRQEHGLVAEWRQEREG